MCIVCTLWEQERLQTEEAYRAVFERINTEDLSDEERDHILYELMPRIVKAIGYDLTQLYPDSPDYVVIKGEE